ncbi:MAG: phosphoribosylformylglycinamidine synthase subunit PurS, partial [Planctomycetes bacterium]|nr:phosphoribosylformylglycinamidine synthase subunit PurS [Planctomycetota bacterium]
MSIHRIEIATRDAACDSAGKGVAEDLQHFGLSGVESVRTVRVFTISGIEQAQCELAARDFLADAVTDLYSVDQDVLSEPGTIVEISRLPGVMDPVEQSVRKGLRHLGLTPDWVRASTKYIINCAATPEEVRFAAQKLLGNEIIEEITVGENAKHDASAAPDYQFNRIEVCLDSLDDEALLELSTSKALYLSLPEMKCIQEYFQKAGRNPTDVELEILAQTWSEHCVHKTLKGRVRYQGPEGTEVIDNLLKSTIAKVTTELNKPWCLSVFKDNAGVISFDEDYGAVFKVETHNHPSALDPYGGAGTGIGGVIRDCLGTGLGAKPVMNTDIF